MTRIHLYSDLFGEIFEMKICFNVSQEISNEIDDTE